MCQHTNIVKWNAEAPVNKEVGVFKTIVIILSQRSARLGWNPTSTSADDQSTYQNHTRHNSGQSESRWISGGFKCALFTLAKSLATCELAEQCTLENVYWHCAGHAQHARASHYTCTQGSFRFRFALEGAGQS